MTDDGFIVRPARPEDVAEVARLFDGYRQFYGKPSDLDAAETFLAERLHNGDSLILIAERGGEKIGFTQLYPSFTSVGMARTYVLNDLFVAQEGRGRGVAQALLEAGARAARDQGAVRLTLSTQIDNQPARALYVKTGWARDDKFCVYNLKLTD